MPCIFCIVPCILSLIDVVVLFFVCVFLVMISVVLYGMSLQICWSLISKDFVFEKLSAFSLPFIPTCARTHSSFKSSLAVVVGCCMLFSRSGLAVVGVVFYLVGLVLLL